LKGEGSPNPKRWIGQTAPERRYKAPEEEKSPPVTPEMKRRELLIKRDHRKKKWKACRHGIESKGKKV